MKNIGRYLKKYKIETIFAPLFKLLEASFELLIPIVMTKIIDIGIVNKDINYIIHMCLVMVSLGVIGFICSVTAQYFAAKAAVGVGTLMREDLFAHINKLSFSDLDAIGTSTLITRITNDINQVQNGVNMTLRLLLRSPFIVFGAMLMAFFIDVKSAIVFLVVIPILGVIVFMIILISIPMFKKIQEKIDEIMLLVRENLSGARVIRVFNRQGEENREFIDKINHLKKIQINVGKISSLLNPITYIFIYFSIVLILWVGGKEVSKGQLTQGAVIALISYMTQILGELVKGANLMILITKAIASSKRINDIMVVEPSIKNKIENEMDLQDKAGTSKDNIKKAVEFRNVSFSYYQNGENSLDSVSFVINRGETVGIIGSTGSGKSTLVNLMPRFYDANIGDIFVNEKNVKEYSLDELRSIIGIVPQKTVLFEGTILENILWGNKNASPQDIDEALEIAQAREIVDDKEGGLQYRISQGGKNLSGGQRQRLTIARALIKKPQILVLDDSSSALDYVTDAKLRKAINENTEGMTVFIVAQRAAYIKHLEKILVIEDGKIVGIGNHINLLKSCEVYKEICSSQLSIEEVDAHE